MAIFKLNSAFTDVAAWFTAYLKDSLSAETLLDWNMGASLHMYLGYVPEFLEYYRSHSSIRDSSREWDDCSSGDCQLMIAIAS